MTKDDRMEYYGFLSLVGMICVVVAIWLGGFLSLVGMICVVVAIWLEFDLILPVGLGIICAALAWSILSKQ